jgi:hypothetical protein
MTANDIYRALYMLELRMRTRLLTHTEISFYSELASLALDEGNPDSGCLTVSTTTSYVTARTPARSEADVRDMVEALSQAVLSIEPWPLCEDKREKVLVSVTCVEERSRMRAELVSAYRFGEFGEFSFSINRLMLELLTHDWKNETAQRLTH